MKSRAMRAALVGVCAILALPVGQAIADQTSDLKAEIDAQRKLIEAQRARLDALERKLHKLMRRPIGPQDRSTRDSLQLDFHLGSPGRLLFAGLKLCKQTLNVRKFPFPELTRNHLSPMQSTFAQNELPRRR